MLLLTFLILPLLAQAGVIATAGAGRVRVTLYDEPCALAAVSNLPRRAEWAENGRTFEGCWGASRMLPIIMTYWSDKTVIPFLASAFARIHET